MSVALVLGGASSLWDDAAAALALGEFQGVVACNDAAAAWPGPLDGAVSYHPSKWPLWLAARQARGLPRPVRVFGHMAGNEELGARYRGVFERIWAKFPGQDECGSSGLFALKVALVELGFDKAVLCGVPMDPRGHFFDRDAWTAYTEHRDGWRQALPHIRDRARSMSGWTADLLGRPDAAWLA